MMKAVFFVACLLATLNSGYAMTAKEKACHKRAKNGAVPTFCHTWYCRQNIQRENQGLPLLDLNECKAEFPPYLVQNGKLAVKAQSEAMIQTGDDKVIDSVGIYNQQVQECGSAPIETLIDDGKVFHPCICNATMSRCRCEEVLRTNSFDKPSSPYFQKAYYDKYAREYLTAMEAQVAKYGLDPNLAMATCMDIYKDDPTACSAQSPAARRRRRLAENGLKLGHA